MVGQVFFQGFYGVRGVDEELGIGRDVDLVGYAEIDLLLEVLANAGKVGEQGDLVTLESCSWTDAGGHEELGRAKLADCQSTRLQLTVLTYGPS